MPDSADLSLKDLFIIPDFDAGWITIRFTPPFGIESVVWKVTAEGRPVTAGVVRPTSAVMPQAIATEIPNFRPWSTEDPFLYELPLVLAGTGDETFETRQTFGIYKYEDRGQEIFINNKPALLRGHIRGREAHDHPNLLGLPEEEFYEKNLRATKEYGFNFVRFHSKVPPPAYFRVADRLGVLTHIEVRKYYGKYQKERELMDHDPVLVKPEDWKETVLQVRNHPSLMVYCMGNEINSPGNNPQVKTISAMTKDLDPTRLFIDTCARGEHDRAGVDLDVQHMGYFCPYGRNSEMFNTTSNWAIFGSVSGHDMSSADDDDFATAVTHREVEQNFPVVAHEVCHYVALRDIDGLDAKFAAGPAEKPWWIDELKKLRALKGLQDDYADLIAASRRFQYVWWKQCIESARRSPILSGYHFLQFADTDRYENSNGLLDCFDDPKDVTPEEFRKFNGDTVVVAELPRRAFFESETITVPVWLSHYSGLLELDVTLEWDLAGEDASEISLSGSLDGFELAVPGLRKVATLEMRLPEVENPELATLTVDLTASEGEVIASNDWTVAIFPNRPEGLSPRGLAVHLDGIDVLRRYPQLAPAVGADPEDGLLVANSFTPDVMSHLHEGGDALLLYRVPENHDYDAPREELYIPSTRDRFKGVIWDRGHNLGAIIRQHPATFGFPSDGHLDLHFHSLVDDCDKLVLDDFPGSPTAIIQGVDKASRDRFDVYTFGLRELQPEWTMRRFSYLFETRVGAGRLMVCGFNFLGVESHDPAVCCMFENLLDYCRSDAFRPTASVAPEELEKYLRVKGGSKRVMERMMTQYWQLDEAPLESAQYWKDSEKRIRDEM